MKLTYTDIEPGLIAVFLDGKRVGTIVIEPELDGWRYFPKGKTEGGEKLPTLALVKASLEAE